MNLKERSLGIVVALIELNLFVPAELARTFEKAPKLLQFKSYWEQYGGYKLGDLASACSWSHQAQLARPLEQPQRGYLNTLL